MSLPIRGSTIADLVAAVCQCPSSLSSSLGLLFAEELIQHADDAAGLREVPVLGVGVLEQHVPIPTALQELAAAEQSVVTRLSLADEPLQTVHVLDGLERQGEEKERGGRERAWMRKQ